MLSPTLILLCRKAFVQNFEQVLGLRLAVARYGADAFLEHLEAEWAGYADGLRAGLEELLGADVVDTRAFRFLYPHVPAARSTTEASLTAAFHLHELDAWDRVGDLPGGVVDVVVASQVAGVVVCDGRVDPRDGPDAAFLD